MEQLGISHYWWQRRMLQPLWKTVSQNINLHLPWDPAIPLPGIYAEETNAHVHTKTYMNVRSSFTYNSQKPETIRMSNRKTDRNCGMFL